jgi:hypothetical protein
MRSVAIALALAVGVTPSRADEWKPAAGPLMTRWAKDVTPNKVLPEYPRPQMVREKWQNLNGLWQYSLNGPSQWQTNKILVPFPVESALSGVMKRADRIWYRRNFAIPADWKGQRVLLHFGAVDWEAKVTVNGKLVGEHRGGFDAFSFDITEALKPAGEQEVTVAVWDPTSDGPQPRGKQVTRPSGIDYTPTTGIWQTVWLEPVPAARIAGFKVVPDVDLKRVKVGVDVVGGTKRHHLVVRALWDRTGNPKRREFASESFVHSPQLTATHDLPIVNPRLWSPESPFLYDLRLELKDGDKVIDVVDGYFAMRSVSLGKDDRGITRLMLNGKPYFQAGPLDQGFWPDGLYTAPTDEALRYDIEITKKLGYNMTRKHVKIEPARWYYWCDKLGLVVWQDMPSGERSVPQGKPDMVRSRESAEIYEREWKAIMDQLHNYPCIVMWVPFNEGWGQFDTKRITEWTKKHDPSRLVDCASGWNDHAGVGDVHDIHVYPGPGSPQPESKRAAVLGEFGGLGLSIKGHLWDAKTWSYRGVADSADLTRRYERMLRHVYELRDKPGLSAAVYTQITDVETEANGLLTYDRAVIKVDVNRVSAANRGDFSKVPAVTVVVPTSQQKGLTWRYTSEKPGDDWFKPDFDAGAWKDGPGGFGTKGTPGGVVRTIWKTSDIWLRRTIQLPKGSVDGLQLLLHHDEDAEVYLNGVLAAKVTGFVTDYEEVPIAPAALKALRPGTNTIAIHCKQTGGGQYIDAGLVRVK